MEGHAAPKGQRDMEKIAPGGKKSEEGGGQKDNTGPFETGKKKG